MPDIQEAKCYEFTVRILPPPPLGAPRGGQKNVLPLRANFAPPPRFISVYALVEQARIQGGRGQ